MKSKGTIFMAIVSIIGGLASIIEGVSKFVTKEEETEETE